MIKRIIIFSATVVLLFFVGSFLHNLYLGKNDIYPRFLPTAVYGFHTIATLMVYVMVEFALKKIPNETGYLYLASMMVKLGLFVLIFKNSLFSDTSLTSPEKLILVLPLFIFLIVEVIGIAKILNGFNGSINIDNQ